MFFSLISSSSSRSCYDAFPGCELCVSLKSLQLPDEDDVQTSAADGGVVSGTFAFSLKCAGLEVGE